MNDLPAGFVEMLAGLPGHEKVAEALVNEESPVAVRFNPAKKSPLTVAENRDTVPWEPEGCYLKERPQFTFMPELHDGRFYVQDPSSMIVGEAVRRIVRLLDGPVRYLDACAAPGGKTTAALASLPEGSFVFANEYEPDRCSNLIENLQRWGATNYAVGRNDACRLSSIGEVFDIVAADVPCSGEGMMRKNKTASEQWSRTLIEECSSLQRRIVESVWQTLKHGGFLIYSTCTFNKTENEENAAWIRDSLGAETVDLDLCGFPGVIAGLDRDIPSARFLPGNVRGEGQFIAVFRKPEAVSQSPKLRVLTPKETVSLPKWMPKGFIGIAGRNGEIYAIEEAHAPLVNHLSKAANVILPGTHVATPKGRDFIPAHALATSLALKSDVFPEINVEYADAIAFLRGESIKLPDSAPRGIVLVSNRGYRLGWAKNLGSRANNLVPQSRRIRSSHAPETPPVLFG